MDDINGNGFFPAPSSSWISSIALPLVSGIKSQTNMVPNKLKVVNSQNVLYIWIVDTKHVKNLTMKKVKIQLDIQTTEQATP